MICKACNNDAGIMGTGLITVMIQGWKGETLIKMRLCETCEVKVPKIIQKVLIPFTNDSLL